MHTCSLALLRVLVGLLIVGFGGRCCVVVVEFVSGEVVALFLLLWVVVVVCVVSGSTLSSSLCALDGNDFGEDTLPFRCFVPVLQCAPGHFSVRGS